MSDIVERLRSGAEHKTLVTTGLINQAADEIERLRAEVQTWVNHTKTAVWSDSEECRLLAADNERLRAALRAVDDEHGYGLPPETRKMIHTALKEDGE